MKALLLLFSLLLIYSQMSSAQVEESYVDFSVSPAVVKDGNIQIAFEWLTPNEFRKTKLALMDLHKISNLHPQSNHMVASKIAFIAKKSFEELSHASMNRAVYIAHMLNSVSIKSKGTDLWSVTNRVRAYRIPFRVNFEFRFREVEASAFSAAVTDFLKDEASGFKGTGRERFLTLDMTNFSQLIYRNYSIVYVKELGPKEVLIVSGVITGFDIDNANTFFNFPPFSTSKGTMMSNLRSQILHMVRSIQK